MKKGLTILIGDRNKNIRDFLKREFESEDFRVRLARDGREILAAIHDSDRPHLLIMDLFIQIVDGLLVLEKLQETAPDLPVVIYTSLVEYRDDPAVIKAADAFIEKEEGIDALKAAVFELVAKVDADGVTQDASVGNA